MTYSIKLMDKKFINQQYLINHNKDAKHTK